MCCWHPGKPDGLTNVNWTWLFAANRRQLGQNAFYYIFKDVPHRRKHCFEMYLFRRTCIYRAHITSENSRLKVWEESLCITDPTVESYIFPACITLNIEWWQLLRAFEEWDIEECCHIILVMGNSCWLWNSDVKIRPLQKLNLETGRVMQGDRSVPM